MSGLFGTVTDGFFAVILSGFFTKNTHCEGEIEIYELENGEKLYSSSEINSDEQIESVRILYS